VSNIKAYNRLIDKVGSTVTWSIVGLCVEEIVTNWVSLF
jgi:hypothetical protein